MLSHRTLERGGGNNGSLSNDCGEGTKPTFFFIVGKLFSRMDLVACVGIGFFVLFKIASICFCFS
jgi:hypothetical protein